MVKRDFGDWTVDVDIDATQRLYPQGCLGDADVCGCYECANFVALRAEVFPDDFRRFLRAMGINLECEKRISCYGEVRANRFLYQGYYEFVGQVIGKPAELPDGWAEVYPGFSISMGESPYEVCAFEDNHISLLEFLIETPWAS